MLILELFLPLAIIWLIHKKTLFDIGHNNIMYSYSKMLSIGVCLGCASYKCLSFYCYTVASVSCQEMRFAGSMNYF